ncbi:hypothetical protein UPYG_G00285570 [Umbra pygmaea]|uniref:Soluble lamin-associated protein of 75 kDa-like n=1 Tax=Umbra pygmaea TaxID=75934 RepID=A0ABD0W3X5_UMBPY
MEYPVDVLGSVRPEEEEQAANHYMTQLRYISPDQTDNFTLACHRKIRISLSNVGFMPIYGGDLKHKILALFCPDDQLTAVALYLAGKWWSIEDILKTSDPSRTGLVKVMSLGEQIVLYVLNRIVYRVWEMDTLEAPFLCHGQHDFTKLLWKDGQAIGFYSVKPKDSLCSNFVTQCYQLPVMDSIFVRKGHRGKDHGLQMLEDFVDTFKDEQLGLKYPLSLTMYKVCSRYLCRYPADQDLLWVVEGVGGPYQKESVSSKIKALVLKGVLHMGKANGGHQAARLNSTDVNMDEEEENCLDSPERGLVVNKHLQFIEALDEMPQLQNRNSGLKKRSREETEDSVDESLPLKMHRMEDEELKVEPTTTTSEVGEKEGPEVADMESGEGQRTVALIVQEEPTAQEVGDVNEELTDDQAEEEGKEGEVQVAPQQPEAALENELTEEDKEIKEEEETIKDKDSIEPKDTVEAAPVESKELTEAMVENKDTLGLFKEPASTAEMAHLPAEQVPAEPFIPGEGGEQAVGQPPAPSEHTSSTPTGAENTIEAVCVLSEEVADTLVEGEKEQMDGMDEEPVDKISSEDSDPVDSSATVAQVELEDLSYQTLEAAENQLPTEAQGNAVEDIVQEEEMKEVDEKAPTADEEELEESESSEEGGGIKVLSGRRSVSQAWHKRTSKRLSRVVMESGEQSEATEEEEEKARTTEDEERAVEKSWAEVEEEEEEEPPVIDQRALRRKFKPGQTPKKTRGKRCSKI